MASYDLKSVIKPIKCIAPVSVDAVATVGEIIDTDGFEGFDFEISCGVLGGTVTPSLDDGDDSALSDAATVATDFMVGTIADATFSATDDGLIKRIGYVGKKRYVRLTLTTTSTGNLIQANCVKGYPRSISTVA